MGLISVKGRELEVVLFLCLLRRLLSETKLFSLGCSREPWDRCEVCGPGMHQLQSPCAMQ